MIDSLEDEKEAGMRKLRRNRPALVTAAAPPCKRRSLPHVNEAQEF